MASGSFSFYVFLKHPNIVNDFSLWPDITGGNITRARTKSIHFNCRGKKKNVEEWPNDFKHVLKQRLFRVPSGYMKEQKEPDATSIPLGGAAPVEERLQAHPSHKTENSRVEAACVCLSCFRSHCSSVSHFLPQLRTKICSDNVKYLPWTVTWKVSFKKLERRTNTLARTSALMFLL